MNLILTHYKYDDVNVPLFQNKVALYSYFENLEDKVEIENVNFNAGNLLSTTQVVDIPDTLSLFKILNYNYCVVDNGKLDETLYFKIKRSTQEQANRVRLELEIDAFNSYGYDLLATNPQAVIKRAHLNRFDFFHMSGNDAPFNFDKFSPLFEREAIKNVAMRTTDKTKLKFIIDTTSENSTFNNFIYDNILCWKYYFLSSNVSYAYADFNGVAHDEHLSAMAYYRGGLSTENSNFVVLCAPIYKSTSSKKIYVNPQSQYSKKLWSDNAIYNFIINQANGGWPEVKAIKFSLIPPFPIKNILSTYYEIDANGDMIWKRDDNPTAFYLDSASSSNCFGRRTIQNVDDKILLTSKQFAPIYHSFTDDRLSKEPKLFNEDYATYKLYFGGQQFELPVSKTSFNPKFYYHEILSPEITKGMVCFATTKELTFGNVSNNVFSEDTESNFTGFSFNIDLGLWIPQNQLENFLANNKNFFQINANNAKTRATIAGINALGGMIQGAGSDNPAGAIANSGLGLLTTGISMLNEATNRELTLDNMRNAPDSVANLNSNPLLMASISNDFGIFIELQKPLVHEQNMIVDYFDKYGYVYNRLGIINNFIKTRKMFNYIEADINDIHIKASEDIKIMLQNMFAKGVRFWHNKDVEIQYNLNNYELEWEL